MSNKYTEFQTGLAFVELLITLIVVALLARMAYPTYKEAMLKAHRAEARAALHSVMLQQERFYTQHNTYRAFSSQAEKSPFKRWSGDSAATSYYEISGAACSNKPLSQCILLTATANTETAKGFTDPICGDLMLDSANNKTHSKGGESNPACW